MGETEAGRQERAAVAVLEEEAPDALRAAHGGDVSRAGGGQHPSPWGARRPFLWRARPFSPRGRVERRDTSDPSWVGRARVCVSHQALFTALPQPTRFGVMEHNTRASRLTPRGGHGGGRGGRLVADIKAGMAADAVAGWWRTSRPACTRLWYPLATTSRRQGTFSSAWWVDWGVASPAKRTSSSSHSTHKDPLNRQHGALG